MKKKVQVAKAKFETLRSTVFKAKPVPRTSVKATGKRGS